jgi:NAD(P)-dependent dehydrogenase (short-subunit alcohol dehydrogenase family)
MSHKTVVLITGATAGIGRDAALRLARAGYHVIAAGRRTDALARLEREARDFRLDSVRLDVNDATSIDAAYAEVIRLTDGHGVDVLVNNAGFGMAAPMIETTDADLRSQYETNVFGLMAVTRAFTKEMLARGSGRIVNVSSIGGRVTMPFMGAYNSTKYAVESISDALRRELRPLGIRVSLIEPGLIRSEFSSTTMDWVEKYKSDTSPYAAVYARAEEIRKMSDARAADPECVSRAIEHAIASRRPRARYVMPLSGKLFVWLAGWLPTSWLDYVFSRALGVTPRPVAALPSPAPATEAT